MKNLGTLFGYEMKKLWKRPLTWVAVLMCCVGFLDSITHILGLRLNWIQFGVLMYLAATVVLLTLCWLGWWRSAVGGT